MSTFKKLKRQNRLNSFEQPYQHDNISHNSNEAGLALIEFVKRKDLKKIKALINMGVNANTKDKEGWTALHHASYLNDHKIASYLLDCGSDPDIIDHAGYTTLDVTDDFDMIELLTNSSPTAKTFTIEEFNNSLSPALIKNSL